MVQGFQLLTLPGQPHHQITADLLGIKRMHRLTQRQHHIIRHIRRRIHRLLAGKQQLPLQPPRRRGLRINTTYPTQPKPLRLGLRPQIHVDKLRCWLRYLRKLRQRRILVGRRQPKPGRQFPRQPPGRQRIATIRGNIHIKNRVIQAQHLPGIRTRLPRIQRENTRRPGGEPQLRSGTNHTLRHVTIRLPRRNLETTRQHRPRQRHHHNVAHRKILGATNNILHLIRPHQHLAVADRLLKLRQLLDGDHPAQHQWAGGFRNRLVSFGLKPHLHIHGIQLRRSHTSETWKQTLNPTLSNKHYPNISFMPGFRKVQ